jgi:multidrug transporter EmrE-like cation transporter
MQFDFSVNSFPRSIISLALTGNKIYGTLLGDKNRRALAAARASSNIIRCTFAAIAISFLQDLVDAIGIGWAFAILSGLCLFATGLFLLDYCKGAAWRQESLRQLAEKRRTVVVD